MQWLMAAQEEGVCRG